jgi:lysophospholipase L1-like esterase
MQEKIKQDGGPSYELIGAGIGGNKVYDLYLRFQEDVLDKKPDVVVIYIGVNDVWHKQSSQTGTDPDKFLAFYTAMIKKLQASGIQVIVCTPAVIGERTDFSNSLDGDLNRYSQMIRDLASKYGCRLVDLRKAFLEYNRVNNPDNKESGILTTDRVHLNPKGNQLLADLMFKGLSTN